LKFVVNFSFQEVKTLEFSKFSKNLRKFFHFILQAFLIFVKQPLGIEDSNSDELENEAQIELFSWSKSWKNILKEQTVK